MFDLVITVVSDQNSVQSPSTYLPSYMLPIQHIPLIIHTIENLLSYTSKIIFLCTSEEKQNIERLFEKYYMGRKVYPSPFFIVSQSYEGFDVLGSLILDQVSSPDILFIASNIFIFSDISTTASKFLKSGFPIVASMHTVQETCPFSYIDGDGMLLSYRSKGIPQVGKTGVSISSYRKFNPFFFIKKNILNKIPEGLYSFSEDFIPFLILEKIPIKVIRMPFIIEIYNMSSYLDTVRKAAKNNISEKQNSIGGIVRNSFVDQTSIIEDKCVISNCIIHSGVVMKSNTKATNCIIEPHTIIGSNSILTNCFVSKDTRVDSHTVVINKKISRIQ